MTGKPAQIPAIRTADPVDTLRFMFAVGIECSCPPIYRIWLGANKYDWDFLDPIMSEMRRLGIVPVIDLLHFGLPDFLHDFQNPEWPDRFAEYAHAFAERYPWVRY